MNYKKSINDHLYLVDLEKQFYLPDSLLQQALMCCYMYPGGLWSI